MKNTNGNKTKQPNAVVLLSGGMDSAVCLAIARSKGFACHTLCIDYGQRHWVEIEAASEVANAMQVVEHRVVKLAIGDWGGSTLTDHSLGMPHQASEGIPTTYVPARNTLFLSAALSWSEVLNAEAIFFGANKDDYTNYPDCRPEYFCAFEKMAALATRAGVEGAKIKIHTPLIRYDKIEIIKKGRELGIDFEMTFSCYDPSELNQPCLKCDACRLRESALRLS